MPFGTDLLGSHNNLTFPYLYFGGKVLLLSGLLMGQLAYLRWHPDLAEPSLTAAVVRRITGGTALFATIPLSMAAVFYNTHLALYIYLLLPIVHFLPGRIDLHELENTGGQR